MSINGFEAWGIQPEDTSPPDAKPATTPPANATEGSEQTDRSGEAEGAQEGLPAVVVETRETASETAKAGEEAFSALMRGDTQTAGAAAQKFLAGALPLVGHIAIGILIIIIALMVAGRARNFVEKAIRRARVDETLAKFFAQLAKWAIIIVGLISAIGYMGVPTASFAAVIGGASLAIGLAFQGSLGNLAAGVMLLIFRPFKIGDVVQVGGITAKVAQIDLFTTLMDTPDNRRIIMPNGKIFGSEIENITHHPVRRVDVSVGTAYGSSVDETREVLMRAVKGTQGVLTDPAPEIYLNELGGSAVEWAVRAWSKTPDYWAVKERLTRAVKVSLDEAGISIPFPQMDVHIDGWVKRE